MQSIGAGTHFKVAVYFRTYTTFLNKFLINNMLRNICFNREI